MSLIEYIVGYIVVLAMLYAFWEVQIEGKHGWGEKLPCWRKETWLTEKLCGKNVPLTSYHIGLMAFMIAVFHLVFFFIPWNISAEFFISGLFLEFIILADFFWFAINPHFGLKKFKKSEIWWWKKWLGPVPSWYVYDTIFAAILIYFGYPGIS